VSNYYEELMTKRKQEPFTVPVAGGALTSTPQTNFGITGTAQQPEYSAPSNNFLTPAVRQNAIESATKALPTEMLAPSPSQVVKPDASTSFPSPPQTEYEKYWKTPVGTSKYNMPLDQFVNIAGLAAKYLDPQNPVANDLIKMGGEAYKERARREYEGPNVLLERRLRSAQAQAAESGLAGQKAMGDYVSSWPQRELTLKQKGMTQDAVDSEFVKGMIATIAPHSPEKAAALQEKMIEAKENRKLREYAQDMKDYFSELKIDQAIASGLRAERTLEEQKRHNKVIEKFREDEITSKQAKEEEEKWYHTGNDPATGRPLFTNRRGNTMLGNLPTGVKSIAPKTEKPPTQKSKFTEDMYKKLRLKIMNIERKKKGLPPLPELPDDKQGTKPATAVSQYPDGTIIKNSAGKRKIMRNGEFVDYIGGES